MTPHHIQQYPLGNEHRQLQEQASDGSYQGCKMEKNPSNGNQDVPEIYEVHVKGHLDDRWVDWFGEVTLTREDSGNTRLTCPGFDQAALYGLLKKVRDLGLPLLSVNPVQINQLNSKKGEMK